MRPASSSAKSHLRSAIAGLRAQGISEIYEYGRRFDGVIPMWFGESDLKTPLALRRAAAASLERGETFYEPQSGRDELRAALAAYDERLHGRTVAVDRITVTASGMTAIHIALQAVCDAGDNVVLVVPLWPNAQASVEMLGAAPRRVALRPDGDGRWHLDLARLFDACDGRTRAIFVNSPNNPTGWTASAEEVAAILAFGRERGIWIVADEVYKRLAYGRAVAPSFLDIAEPEDLVFAVNSFSKNWAMTGWRLGWLTAPPSVQPALGNMVQYISSNSPGFVQAGGLAALHEGEPFVGEFRAYCARARDIVCEILGRANRVRIAPPDAAFYAFFAVEGETDSMELAKQLVREARVGVAPGISFGMESEGWLRLCFAQDPALLERGLAALAEALR